MGEELPIAHVGKGTDFPLPVVELSYMGAFREPETAPALIETTGVPDTFCTRIGRIEKLPGGNFRFVLVSEQTDSEGRKELIVVAKLVASGIDVPTALRQVAYACLSKAATYLHVSELFH